MTQTVKGFDLLDARVSIFNHRNLKRIDWILAGLVVLLALIGLAVLYSASQSTSAPTPYYQKQTMFFAVGIVLALVLMCVDSRFLVSLAPFAFIGINLLLLAVILFGVSAKGGQRWLPVGPFRLQPSEQSKLVLVFAMTWYLTVVKDRIRKLPFLLIGFAIIGLPAILILKQPNLGTAVVLLPVGVAMMFVAGCRWWYLAAFALAGLAAGIAAYPNLKDYQKDRIQTFLNPELDPDGTGWQPLQSKVTVGSGGLSGKGYLKGTQTMLNYLPEHHTDFIFSHLAEEKGFVGTVTVIALFAAFLLRGLKFARDCPDLAGALLATGCVTILAVHIFVNIAITVGLMPVTGIPLPFLSYGGNFYLTTMMCVGVLLNVPVRRHLFE